jgi:uncharacterized protein
MFGSHELRMHGVAFAVCGLLSGCVLMGDWSPLASIERRQVFRPAKYPSGDWEPFELEYEDVTFKSADGTKLNGWYVPHQAPRAVILYAHGNAGNVSVHVKTLKELNERHDAAVFVFDYRGYGKSEGSPSEDGILQDARAARKWLAKRTGLDEGEIVLMGRSLGGGVMVDLAAKDGCRGLILESTFTSLPDVAGRLLPLVPTGWLMTQRLDSLSKISQYKGPLLQSHGDKDRLIPIAQGKKLFNAAKGSKRFIVIKGGGHGVLRPDYYHEALAEFFESLPAPGSLDVRSVKPSEAPAEKPKRRSDEDRFSKEW